MILILSGAFVGDELCIEFGKIPPSMIPIKGDRVIYQQISILKKTFGNASDVITLTLPYNYEIEAFDKQRLKKEGVQIRCVDPDLTIGESILFALANCQSLEEPLWILHGDTLFKNLPKEIGCCLIGVPDHDYGWEVMKSKDDETVFAGFSSFNSVQEFVSKLMLHDKDYLKVQHDFPISKRIKNDDWFDFGTVSTFQLSRRFLLASRAFNTFDVDGRILKKNSADSTKLKREWLWYKNWPDALRGYTPQTFGFKDNDDVGYCIEYLPLSSLAEILVFGTHPENYIKNLVRPIFRYLVSAMNFANANAGSVDCSSIDSQKKFLYCDKVEKRLSEYPNFLDIDTEYTVNGTKYASVRKIAKNCGDICAKSETGLNTYHGDLCLSNILFDFRLMDLKLIDPRGIDSREDLIQDRLYDFAKLSHSIFGSYDLINFGRYSVLNSDYSNSIEFDIYFPKNWQFLKSAWFDLEQEFNIEIAGPSKAAVILLFLSMIPLHHDDKKKQTAFLANALQLSGELENV